MRARVILNPLNNLLEDSQQKSNGISVPYPFCFSLWLCYTFQNKEVLVLALLEQS
jgi:hypothetical protein